jgi:hypothetical protein
MDELDYAATLGNDWARRIVTVENAKVLTAVCGDDPVLPQGICAAGEDEMIVVGLTRGDETWVDDGGWHPGVTCDLNDLALLDADEVAFVARGLIEGHSGIVLRSYTPVGFLAAAASMPQPGGTGQSPPPTSTQQVSDLPAGAKVLAVVDDLDRNAVLEVVAVAPGPTVYRRHDGGWQQDDDWVRILRSVKPPPVVQLDDTQLGSVLPQVDEATRGAPFLKEPKSKTTTASAVDARANEMALAWTLLAASKNPARVAESKGRPSGAMPGQLKRYWTAGPGAAKIRWGTPGAWRRCHRLLSKYVGPYVAKGTCTNIAKLRGGHGVATHVGV